MGGRFSDFDQMVAEMMVEFGFQATYQRTSSTPNDATGGVELSTQEIAINCIRSELFRPLNGSSGTRSGTDIQEGDLILYVQPTEKADEFADALVVNAASDSIVFPDGSTWAIVTSKLHATDPSDAILYEMYIRK